MPTHHLADDEIRGLSEGVNEIIESKRSILAQVPIIKKTKQTCFQLIYRSIFSTLYLHMQTMNWNTSIPCSTIDNIGLSSVWIPDRYSACDWLSLWLIK